MGTSLTQAELKKLLFDIYIETLECGLVPHYEKNTFNQEGEKKKLSEYFLHCMFRYNVDVCVSFEHSDLNYKSDGFISIVICYHEQYYEFQYSINSDNDSSYTSIVDLDINEGDINQDDLVARIVKPIKVIKTIYD